jgi:hypothetical protein
MIGGVLLDEHYPAWWPGAITAAVPWLALRWIGGPDAPPLGTKDPQILEWLEANQFILVTDNRSTMPGHLADFNDRGRHVLGIFIALKGFDVRVLCASLRTDRRGFTAGRIPGSGSVSATAGTPLIKAPA